MKCFLWIKSSMLAKSDFRCLKGLRKVSSMTAKVPQKPQRGPKRSPKAAKVRHQGPQRRPKDLPKVAKESQPYPKVLSKNPSASQGATRVPKRPPKPVSEGPKTTKKTPSRAKLTGVPTETVYIKSISLGSGQCSGIIFFHALLENTIHSFRPARILAEHHA